MAFTKLTTDVEHVQALNDRPNANSGLTADQVKAVFDQAGTDIKTYINNVLTPELDSNSGVSLGIANVKNFGAIGDGVADDTAAVALAYASAVSSKSILYFPGGTFKFNLNVLDSSVRIEGSGRKRRDSAGLLTGGTRFIHADVSLPVLKIGDGITSIYDVSFLGFSIQGDSSTVGSDGIVIKGAYWTNGWDFRVDSCGGDNIRIEEGSAVPTSYVYLNQFTSSYARNGNSVKITTGVQPTSAIFFSNFSLQGWSATGCRALYLGNTVELALTNGYIQVDSSEVGNVWIDGLSAKIRGSIVYIDSNLSTDVLVNINGAAGVVERSITGTVFIDGKIKFSDGNLVASPKPSLQDGSNLSNPNISTNIYFGNTVATDGSNQILNVNSPHMYQRLKGNTVTVSLDSGGLNLPMTYLLPLLCNAGGAIWRNATTGQLRYRFDSFSPTADTNGNALSEFVPVPASATAAGHPGNWSADATWLYLCHAEATWKRVAIATW